MLFMWRFRFKFIPACKTLIDESDSRSLFYFYHPIFVQKSHTEAIINKMQASTVNSDFFPRVVFTRKIKVDLPPPLKGRDLETTQPKTEPTKSDGAAFVAAFVAPAAA